MTSITWLITGCSSGFGEIFVHRLLARGDHVIATGRNASERLGHLKAIGARILDLDITEPQEILNIKMEEAIGFFGGIDVLVNNAGYIELGLAEEVSHESWLNQINTNFFGAVNMTRAILIHFRKRGSGKIVFIGSYVGWCGELGSAPYSTSKFALEGYVECLQKEVSDLGIQSIIFEPGSYRTNLLTTQNRRLTLSTHADYKPVFAALMAGVQSVEGRQGGDPVECVERMIDVVKLDGMAAGRRMPKRLPLGRYAMDCVKAKCLDTLRLCEEWEDVICSTERGPENGGNKG